MPKLKVRLTTTEYDALPEALRDLYAQNGDEYTLDADLPDVGALTRAKEYERIERQKLSKELTAVREQFKDLDPERAREALAKLHELEEKDLLGKGNIDALFEKRMAPVKRDHQAQLTTLQSQLKEATDKYGQLSEKYAQTARSAMLAAAAAECHVDPEWMEYVDLKAQQVWRLDEETGELTAYGPDRTPLYGKDGKKLTLAEWIGNGLAKEKPKILLPSNGSGAPGSAGPRQQGKDIVLSREQALDVPTFRAAREQATKQGGQVVTE